MIYIAISVSLWMHVFVYYFVNHNNKKHGAYYNLASVVLWVIWPLGLAVIMGVNLSAYLRSLDEWLSISIDKAQSDIEANEIQIELEQAKIGLINLQIAELEMK